MSTDHLSAEPSYEASKSVALSTTMSTKLISETRAMDSYDTLANDGNNENINIRNENTKFWLLYVSHFSQTFGDRLWEFAVPILFTLLFDNTIFPQALYSFAIFFALIMIMPLFGGWIDNANRIKVITITILLQNIMVIISCIFLYLMSILLENSSEDYITSIDWKLILIFSGLLIVAMIGHLMGSGATLALEKDWIVALCTNNSEQLTISNSIMKRIDLMNKIIAPALFGIYIEYVGNTNKQKIEFGALVVLLWNVCGFFLEYATLRMLYYQNISILGTKIRKDEANTKKNKNMFVNLYRGWNLWIRSKMLFASIAYCGLYVNILSGGAMVTAYLRFAGMSFTVLGIGKGIGALFGIVGTMTVPFLHNKLNWSMKYIGLLSLYFFAFSIGLASITFIVERIQGSFDAFSFKLFGDTYIDYTYVILLGMIISRTPLWIFDIAENQLMQTEIPSDIRALVNSVQIAVANIFFILLTILGMIFAEVHQFYVLVFFSMTMVVLSAILYSLWYTFPAKWGHDHYKSLLLGEL